MAHRTNASPAWLSLACLIFIACAGQSNANSGSSASGPSSESGSATRTDSGTDSDNDATADTSTADTSTTSSSTTGVDGECPLGEWQGNTSDKRLPSEQPPCGLSPAEVPMFVVLGWDDNAAAEGMTWSTQVASAQTNADGTPVLFTYYNTSTYAAAAGAAWKTAYDGGHEMGNHTINHNTSNMTDAATWEAEMQGCHDTMVGLGIESSDIYGFRTPFLSGNDDTITQVQDMGYWYDCSLEEGYQYDQDGTNFLWPYTLDEGSPGNDLVADEWESPAKGTVEPHPGLWEMPSYTLMIPNDEDCEALGIAPGLQQRVVTNIMASEGWTWEPPKITGFDYNLWYSARLTREEFTAVLKHTLNLRLAGNRAPFLVGTHSSYYVSSWDANSPNANMADRRAAVEDFVSYATSLQEVRVTTAKATLDWVRNPEPI